MIDDTTFSAAYSALMASRPSCRAWLRWSSSVKQVRRKFAGTVRAAARGQLFPPVRVRLQAPDLRFRKLWFVALKNQAAVRSAEAKAIG